MKTKTGFLVVISAMLAACAGTTQPMKFGESVMLTRDSYLNSKLQNGVVLLDVNWNRWWGCGTHENAQLVSFAFDKLPLKSINNETEPTLVLQGPSRLTAEPGFLHYAYALEPGTYALSFFSIKVADSMSKIGFFTVPREKLFSEEEPLGGTFTVKPGEVVFIGNFYLDCAYGPILWRYHPVGEVGFKAQMDAFARQFPYLELDDARFRLFETKDFGNDYELVP